jgi:predicted GH43/DUF377 family glycosyl hydrolase
MRSYGIPVERLNGGDPIISPTANWWETGVTFNAAAVYLPRSPETDAIIRALLPMRTLDDPQLVEGVVAIHYRARPEIDPGSAFVRSFIGLALFTPALEPLYRYQEPVIYPDPDPDGFDRLGVEDPRITRLGDTFWMVYCGVRADPTRTYRARLCLARSTDLLHWEKLGPVDGDINEALNKDGVPFPEPVDGRYYMLHRPYYEGLLLDDFDIHLAVAPAMTGPWRDLGPILHSFPNPLCPHSWVGGGSVPIAMGGGRFAEIYHTGNYLNDVDREYDLDIALLDFSRFDPAHPETLVTARIEHLMTPETEAELRSRSALMVGNVLFACGSYEYGGDIVIVYGGADTYTLAARVNKATLFAALENADLTNPHQQLRAQP